MKTTEDTESKQGMTCSRCDATHQSILIGTLCGNCKTNDIGRESWDKMTDAQQTIIAAAFPNSGYPDVEWTSKKSPDRLLEIAYQKAAKSDPTLKSVCRSCDGSGIYDPTYVIPQCYRCNGRGAEYAKLESNLQRYVAALGSS